MATSILMPGASGDNPVLVNTAALHDPIVDIGNFFANHSTSHTRTPYDAGSNLTSPSDMRAIPYKRAFDVLKERAVRFDTVIEGTMLWTENDLIYFVLPVSKIAAMTIYQTRKSFNDAMPPEIAEEGPTPKFTMQQRETAYSLSHYGLSFELSGEGTATYDGAQQIMDYSIMFNSIVMRHLNMLVMDALNTCKSRNHPVNNGIYIRREFRQSQFTDTRDTFCLMLKDGYRAENHISDVIASMRNKNRNPNYILTHQKVITMMGRQMTEKQIEYSILTAEGMTHRRKGPIRRHFEGLGLTVIQKPPVPIEGRTTYIDQLMSTYTTGEGNVLAPFPELFANGRGRHMVSCKMYNENRDMDQIVEFLDMLKASCRFDDAGNLRTPPSGDIDPFDTFAMPVHTKDHDYYVKYAKYFAEMRTEYITKTYLNDMAKCMIEAGNLHRIQDDLALGHSIVRYCNEALEAGGTKLEPAAINTKPVDSPGPDQTKPPLDKDVLQLTQTHSSARVNTLIPDSFDEPRSLFGLGNWAGIYAISKQTSANQTVKEIIAKANKFVEAFLILTDAMCNAFPDSLFMQPEARYPWFPEQAHEKLFGHAQVLFDQVYHTDQVPLFSGGASGPKDGALGTSVIKLTTEAFASIALPTSTASDGVRTAAGDMAITSTAFFKTLSDEKQSDILAAANDIAAKSGGSPVGVIDIIITMTADGKSNARTAMHTAWKAFKNAPAGIKLLGEAFTTLAKDTKTATKGNRLPLTVSRAQMYTMYANVTPGDPSTFFLSPMRKVAKGKPTLVGHRVGFALPMGYATAKDKEAAAASTSLTKGKEPAKDAASMIGGKSSGSMAKHTPIELHEYILREADYESEGSPMTMKFWAPMSIRMLTDQARNTKNPSTANLKKAMGDLDCGNHNLANMVMSVFLTTPITLPAIECMFNANMCCLPFGAYLARPWRRAVYHKQILGVSGADTGVTIYNFQHVTRSKEGHSHRLSMNAAWYAGAHVFEPEAIEHLEMVAPAAYRGGHNLQPIKFMSNGVDQVRNRQELGSVFVYIEPIVNLRKLPVPVDIGLTGSMAARDNGWNIASGDCFGLSSAWFVLESMHGLRNRFSQGGLSAGTENFINRMCYPGHQINPSKVSGEYNQLDMGANHWTPLIGAGSAALRRGGDSAWTVDRYMKLIQGN
jgi:hypothetical protein